jgi:hypothetical protein
MLGERAGIFLLIESRASYEIDGDADIAPRAGADEVAPGKAWRGFDEARLERRHVGGFDGSRVFVNRPEITVDNFDVVARSRDAVVCSCHIVPRSAAPRDVRGGLPGEVSGTRRILSPIRTFLE